ncbi:MAG: pentapeptide repeat-containing protein, partial [Proteobacteria bacterium]|nr:pentapeptide repeat-containing protein [Pseudomonadota bacterium]
MSSAIDDISSYLRDNKKNIEQIADKALAQPQFQEVLESVGVSHALVREIAANGVDFIASALPLFTKLAQESLKDKEGMIQLMNQFQAAVNAPEAERGKLTMKLVDEIFAFKDRNPEVNRILQEDLPKLLVDNSEGLGKIVDKFLTDSPTGRNINIKGKDIIAVASKNLPQLIEISVLNKNGNYAKLIPKLFKLVTSDKEVLNLVMKAANDWLHYKVQKALTPNIIRKKSADQIGEVLENIGKTADKNNADLRELIGLEAEKHSDKTARYSLRNRDFSGLDLSKQSLNFERRTVEGFNFAGAKLGTISFAGSTIKDCSFKNVKFQKHVSFEGATIDAKSLKTLRTAVAKYNKKHPNKPITLEGIKIIKGKGIFNKSILAEIEVIKRKISGQRPSSTKSKATSQKSQSVLKR